MPNPHEDAARLRKVQKLSDFLRSQRFTAEMAEIMADHEWAAMATAAGVNKPKDESKRMVIQSLREGTPK